MSATYYNGHQGWTFQKYLRFKNAYDEQKKNGAADDAVYMFEGKEVVVKYAYYLIQHLESPT